MGVALPLVALVDTYFGPNERMARHCAIAFYTDGRGADNGHAHRKV